MKKVAVPAAQVDVGAEEQPQHVVVHQRIGDARSKRQ